MVAQRWNSGANTWDPPLSGQVSDAAANTVTVTGVTNFSPWTLARGASPLPVELISFDANCDVNKVEINWQTASEINNDFFVIEKSSNGIDYVEMYKYDLDENDANSNIVKEYSVVDNDPYSGISYYRLKQVDLNGVFEIFDPVMVNCSKSEPFELVSTFADYDNKTIEIVYNNNEIELYIYSTRNACVKIVKYYSLVCL